MLKLTHMQSAVILSCCITALVMIAAFYLLVVRPMRKHARKMIDACDAQIAHLQEMLKFEEESYRMIFGAWYDTHKKLDEAHGTNDVLFQLCDTIFETAKRVLGNDGGGRSPN